MKLADIHILHQSDVYRVVDYKCHCNVCSVTDPEYNTSFCLSFIRKGFFEYRSFKRNDEVHAGRLLISKPGYEHTTRHIDNQPDIVTIFDFSRTFYEETILEQYGNKLPWILGNNDIHSLMVSAGPEMEYLHHRILQRLRSGDHTALEIDEMVMALLERTMQLLGSAKVPETIADRLKQHHLGTIEAAREFILTHFNENISLEQLARHCLVSPFHFSRIFRTITGESPHQYLLSVRLAHAKVLLKTTASSVAAIAYECGFSSPEHFVTSFKKHQKVNPSAFRYSLA